MKSGAILGYVSVMKKLVLFKMSNLIKNAVTDDLWDLSAEVLTELSRRDNVEYRIRASDTSVARKLANLEVN